MDPKSQYLNKSITEADLKFSKISKRGKRKSSQVEQTDPETLRDQRPSRIKKKTTSGLIRKLF